MSSIIPRHFLITLFVVALVGWWWEIVDENGVLSSTELTVHTAMCGSHWEKLFFHRHNWKSDSLSCCTLTHWWLRGKNTWQKRKFMTSLNPIPYIYTNFLFTYSVAIASKACVLSVKWKAHTEKRKLSILNGKIDEVSFFTNDVIYTQQFYSRSSPIIFFFFLIIFTLLLRSCDRKWRSLSPLLKHLFFLSSMNESECEEKGENLLSLSSYCFRICVRIK